MTNPLDDERYQFFLRHRTEIKEWAAIEKEVAVATREVMAGLEADIQARVAGIDETAEVVRHDGGRYERIMIRCASWPVGVGVVLEWELGIDPFGSSVPKFGIFVLPREGGWQLAHRAIDTETRASGELRGLSYKPGDNTWPVVQYVPKSSLWWQDVNAWTSSFVDRLVGTWPLAAPLIERGLALGA